MSSSSDRVLFHCPCRSPLSVSTPPVSTPPLSNYIHHELSSLLFCEECDAIRCKSCVSFEIACYYCPTCLFEVPSASVRGEKNRCSRNCFQCPQCTHTLSLIATDPDPSSYQSTSSAQASIGEPPYFLSCTVCRWDSKMIGVVFEKPTGLAQQLSKQEEANTLVSELQEFDHLKDHFEPFLRKSQLQAAPNSSALKDITSTLGNRYAHLLGTLSSNVNKRNAQESGRDELPEYKPLKTASVMGDAELVDKLRGLKDWEEIAPIEKRWDQSWLFGEDMKGYMADSLRPLRTPLQAKRSKRCPECKHILIKPEQKASSTRFKIKLVASNYLPSIEVYRRPPATIGSRLSAIAAGTASLRRGTPRAAGGSISLSKELDEEPLRPGRTYTFELSCINPLYEPIQVKLALARPAAKNATDDQPGTAPYAVNLPSGYFPISAYAEEWEFEDDDANLDTDDEENEDSEMGEVGEAGSRKTSSKRAKNAAMGIVERKMNRTTVAMEVAVARDTVGPIRANMLVTYVYSNEDASAPPASPVKSPVKGGPKPDVKTFTFWTLFNLGTVTPRSGGEARRSLALSSVST